MSFDYVLFVSYGNDSIALIQWANERGLKNCATVYSDTGWAADYWPARVHKAETWAQGLGFSVFQTESEGMPALVARKKAWPRGGGGKFQFCTEALKKAPARAWLDQHDPKKEATCMNGVRRSESRNRIDAPEWVYESADHGGRELWSPLVRHTVDMRDALILKTPFDVLPTKSKECWPCVNAGKRELRHLEPERIRLIESIETDAGVNKKGNARVMFSPKRHNGAIGIRLVVDDAQKGADDLFPVSICDSGWCSE